MIHRIKEFFGGIFGRSDLSGLDPYEVAEIARELGVSSGELKEIDRHGDDAALMPRRLAEEGVNTAVVQAEWPSVWRDLQRVCSVCDSKDVCQAELDLAPEAPDWQRYCPNVGTITALKN
jgi:hypothetical protein